MARPFFMQQILACSTLIFNIEKGPCRQPFLDVMIRCIILRFGWDWVLKGVIFHKELMFLRDSGFLSLRDVVKTR